jgi:hypothetical protein
MAFDIYSEQQLSDNTVTIWFRFRYTIISKLQIKFIKIYPSLQINYNISYDIGNLKVVGD